MLYWIWLATRQGLSQRTKYELPGHFDTLEELYRAADYGHIPGITEKGYGSLADKSLEEARDILQKCRQKGIRLLSCHDPAYPNRLRGIQAPPVLLYYLGQLPSWEQQPVIGGVGTRNATDYGIGVARQLGYELTAGGGCLVSGMAKGIDGALLSGAMKAKGKPVIILAGGVDVISPRENKHLYEYVGERGCILSEYPPETQHLSWHFRERNRLISGVSDGVLVVEAPEKSGALITADHAQQQGRQVFAVPGPIHQQACKGSNGLLRDGATMVQEGWDILRNYQPLYPGKLKPVQAKMEGENPSPPRGKSPTLEQKHKKIIDKCPPRTYIDVETKPAANPQERAILELLNQGPRLADELIAQSGLPYAQALSTVTVLELRGCLRRLPGNLIARIET